MIELRILDINNKELCNGDTIRYIEINPEFQEHDHSGGLYREQIGTLVEIKHLTVDPDQIYADDSFLSIPPLIEYNTSMLCYAFGLGGDRSNISDAEFKECVIDVICEKIGIKSNEKKMLKILNNFEIISK